MGPAFGGSVDGRGPQPESVCLRQLFVLCLRYVRPVLRVPSEGRLTYIFFARTGPRAAGPQTP